jgi:hypothetical protein
MKNISDVLADSGEENFDIDDEEPPHTININKT